MYERATPNSSQEPKNLKVVKQECLGYVIESFLVHKSLIINNMYFF
ncbi:hypothetical protein RHABOEDO_001641 [Candidatus Rhabdochlamydia oedothoracis]|uniref:Uncharacterized protein n=1 Tax=Candidatus Rhabdochlamydia oedothoracis TaxID=2720720 RepID=A0ABX8V291_9BACT|nr:hypothetical protein RHABOEDO_001641 [Candidatus Rhabdochlamydia oedothoracis]